MSAALGGGARARGLRGGAGVVDRVGFEVKVLDGALGEYVDAVAYER